MSGFGGISSPPPSREKISNIPLTTLGDGNSVGVIINVPSGFTMSVTRIGVQTDANNSPSQLFARVEDSNNNTVAVQTDQKSRSGSPLAQLSGSVDVLFEMLNNTGNTQTASAFFTYRIQ